VILTRQRPVAGFLKPERDRGPLGFHFVREDGEKLTDRDKMPVRRLKRFVLNSGDAYDDRERERLHRDNLHQ
jgi:hypothetical protein